MGKLIVKTTSSESIPDWLPDWRNPNSYDFPPAHFLRLWAWEFLRRNPKYQRDWYNHYVRGELRWVPENERIKSAEEKTRHRNICAWEYNVSISTAAANEGRIVYVPNGIENAEPIMSLSVYLSNIYSLKRIDLCDPAINKPSNELLCFSTQSSPPITTMDRRSRNNTSTGMIPMSPSEVVTKIDLNLPIDVQLGRLKQLLLSDRERLLKNGKLNPRNPRAGGEIGKKYKEYLRILDAKSLRKSDSEIAEVLYPDKSNTHPEYYASSAVKDGFKAAKILRDYEYKYLCLRL